MTIIFLTIAGGSIKFVKTRFLIAQDIIQSFKVIGKPDLGIKLLTRKDNGGYD